MKKLLVMFAFAGLTTAANAQKETILLSANGIYDNGGGVAFEGNKEGARSSGWQINPSIGYQFNDNWTVGLNLGVGGDRQETAAESDNYSKGSNFLAGVFLRYTKNVSPIFDIYGQANLSYLHTKNNPYDANDNDDDATKQNGFQIDVMPAVAVNVKNGFKLNFAFGGIGFRTMKVDVDGAEASNKFFLNFGQHWNIGISKNFSVKRMK